MAWLRSFSPSGTKSDKSRRDGVSRATKRILPSYSPFGTKTPNTCPQTRRAKSFSRTRTATRLSSPKSCPTKLLLGSAATSIRKRSRDDEDEDDLTTIRLTFTLQPQPSTEQANHTIDALIADNEARGGRRSSKGFGFFVRSVSGVLVSGLLGSSHWTHLCVSALFVQEDARREGTGNELMKGAEALAVEK